MAENLNLVVLHDTNRNEDVLPITHEDAVLDADGKSAGTKFAELEEKITLLDTSTNIIDGQTAENGWAGTNGRWVSNNNNYKGYFITVRAGDMYRITANASQFTKIEMLRNSSHVNGASVNSLLEQYISAGKCQDVTVPSGATCMWVGALAGSDGNTTPQSIYAYYGEILDVVISHNNKIGELEENLVDVEVETKVITTYTSSRLIMADSTNADFGNVVSYSNADYAVSPFIDISGYNKFSVSTLTSTAKAGAGTVLYNANKEPLVGYFKAVAPSSFIVSAVIPAEAVYIRITHWTGTFSAGNVKLRLWDELKEFTIRKTAELDDRITALESSGGIPSGLTQYEYIGEKISFVPKFALSTYMSLNLTGTGQGGASYGDYYFVGVGGNGTLNIFSLVTKKKLAAISLAAVDITNAHANTLTFSNQYHTDGDEFPILYICSGYALNNNTKMYGYRIVNENNAWSATLVHTITLASSTWTDAVIDNKRQKLWIKRTGSWYCVDMPQYSNGDATIDLAASTPEFSYPLYEGSGQGHLFYNDKIYFTSGTPDTENVSKLYVLNTKTGKYDSIINLLPILGTSHEPENVFVYNGYLYVASRRSVFKMYFD